MSSHPTTSIRNANLLYLTIFLALLAGSILLPAISLGWRVVINELAFLGLPLALYVLLAGRNLGEALRLRPVPWRVAGLAVLIGLGLWRFDWWLASAVNEVLDYTIPLPPEALNLTLLDKIAMTLGTVVLAPVIEEFLFRGLIQSAYERRGPLRAVVFSALLFVLIHQELAQSIALLPVALALGYVAWRTRSVIPAILVHLGNNGQAMVISFLQEGRLRRAGFTPSLTGALVGGLVAVAALWLLTRWSSRPDREQEPPRRGWLARNWPIFPVVPIYAAVIALGVLVGVRPEALALGQRVELTSAPWEREVRWSYEIRNAVDEPVGEATCSLTPRPDAFVLDCSMEQTAYEADAPTGFFQEGSVTQRQTVRWDRTTLTIVDAEIGATVSEGSAEVELEARVEDGALSVRLDGAGEETRFDRCYRLDGVGEPEGSPHAEEPCRVDGGLLAGGGAFSPLMVGEWPWRLSALPFELAYSRQGTLLWPYRAVEEIDARASAREDVFVVVRTAEQIVTPAGEFVTWRVTVGDKQTAWYAVDPPHHLVAYSDDMVTWRLTEVE
jgi:membrane protease YdiL (CAAX protease family)